LLEYADDQFELNTRGKDGSTLRDHYMAAWESTGVKPYQLDRYAVPDTLMYIWHWFIELCEGRQYGMDGAMPFSFSDIKAWIDLYGYTVTAQEVKILKKLDILAIKDRKK